MQLQPSLNSDSSSSSSLKRPSDQATYATSAAKYAKRDDSSRRRPIQPSKKPSIVSPSFDIMPHHRTSAPAPSGSGSGSGARKPAHPNNKVRSGRKGNAPSKPGVPQVEGPLHNNEYITAEYADVLPQIQEKHIKDPISTPNNVSHLITGKSVSFNKTRIQVNPTGTSWQTVFRTEAVFPSDPPIIGVGDSPKELESRKLAALALLCELQKRNLINFKAKLELKEVTLSDGTVANFDKAKQFMEYYCHRFKFGNPEVTFTETGRFWEAVMTVQDRKIGMGTSTSKKGAQQQCYLDVLQYLEKCDSALWKSFLEKESKGTLQQSRLSMYTSYNLQGRIRDLIVDLRSSDLYKNRPAPATAAISDSSSSFSRRVAPSGPSSNLLAAKSQELRERQQMYKEKPSLERMRATRYALPVYSRSEDILASIEKNDVTILMAATGSGKTTQVPQLILDSFIEKGVGSKYNVLCTQPRRLAALSVAHRVADERGESLGKSVGYIVRFESRPPEPNGSITFCTTGIFLKQLQSALSEGRGELDSVTHVVIDEVHERDVDTDLLLVVVKRLLDDRKARGKPLKVILMSATIDPTLFQNYFPDDNLKPAPVIEVPGRTFPVERHHMDDFFPKIISGPSKWILNDDSVVKYAIRELGISALPPTVPLQRFDEQRINAEAASDIEIPYPLVVATIAHVLKNSDSGHVLTFLAGWDDISAVHKMMLNPNGPLPVNFNGSNYSIHLLHSSVPLAEQQVIFKPPPEGVRRIILATNIAETSVTIPDVVYVVDSARLKEQRYDPEKHVSSLVSSWVGSSNMNQRAGRAGRHRPGEYYGVLSKKHAAELAPYQTVEMSRVDLSNVVMHVKALNFPGMSVEGVLAATIEPPQPDRVAAAMKTLQMVGALDDHKNLTPLGRVLLLIPVDVQAGRLVLLGSFFRCLDQALTLAALLTNRDPFMSPMHMKEEAARAKNSWCPPGIKSDALTALRAYNAWEALHNSGAHHAAHRFCVDNFLSRPTLLLIQKLKSHLLQSVYNAGIIDISGGGGFGDGSRLSIPSELNENGESLTLLASLIALASQPKFAVRWSEKIWRTQLDRTTMVHPSSVMHPKHTDKSEDPSRQIVAFGEKRQNISAGTSGSTTFLVTLTRVEALLYAMFGAHKLEKNEQGLLADDWISVTGNLDSLDDVYDLRKLVDSCMGRVFEGIMMSRRNRFRTKNVAVLPREEEMSESGDDLDDKKDYSLSPTEVKELDLLTRDLVSILNQHSYERGFERPETRPGTPSLSARSLNFPGSGPSTPFGRSEFNSRANTPLGYERGFDRADTRPGTPTTLNYPGSGHSLRSRMNRKF